MIKICNCKHKFQDKKHGAQRRVHNALKKLDKAPQRVRCSVCGDVKVA